ncbi:hypothetical protein BMETH_748_0 [methanotrophic bacterial endosymbiont of Bathymodiolus sp.]|nr:hypothetical protein BMETH_748_0 [methanotrophic bacterial endosymbiont of Bathymodiolus sp.]
MGVFLDYRAKLKRILSLPHARGGVSEPLTRSDSGN